MTTEVSPSPRAAPALDATALASGLSAGALRAEASPPRAFAWLGLGGAMLAGAALFWLFDALPFMDLPAHAGLIALRHRFADSPFEQQYFVYAPHVGPYSLFRALGELFDRIWGPIGAVRALATLPVVATPLAVLFARWRLHRELSPGFGYIGLVLSFGLMTVFGFASYLLGEAALLVALALWLELLVAVDDRDPRARTLEWVAVIAAPILFVAHGHAFVLFLALAGMSCVATGDRARRLVRLRALAPAVALAAWVAWTERVSTLPAGAVAVSEGKMGPSFQGAIEKFSLLLTPTLMTRSGVDAAVGVAIWIVLVAGVIATARALRREARDDRDLRMEPGARHSRALLACLVALAALFLALPHAVGWFGFVDGRLVPLMLFVGLIAIRTSALGSTLQFAFSRLAPAFAAAMLLVNYVASARFQDEARGWHEILSEIPARSRLLNLPLDPNSDVFTGHPFVHYDKLVLVDRPAVVSDVWFHQGTALYPRPGNPSLLLPSDYMSSDLHFNGWSDYRLGDWDYVLVRTRPTEARLPIPVPPSFRLIDHRGGFWLLRKNESGVESGDARPPSAAHP